MARRVAVYGGTFDPPHLGHVAAAKAALAALSPDELLWMPARQAPHKGRALASAEQRLNMCRLAATELGPCVTVSGLEMEADASGYTVDTLSGLAAREPEAELWLVVGQDMLLSLEQWKDPARLLGLCRVAAVCRARGQDQGMEAAAETLRAKYGAVIRLVGHEPVEISSTRLRGMLARGGGHKYLSEPVWAYIRENGVYMDG